MADSAEKIALRNAFAKKLGKTEASNIYVSKDDLDLLSAGVDSVILCQQIISFYNSYNNTSLDYRNYADVKASEWAEVVYAFGRSYNGE